MAKQEEPVADVPGWSGWDEFLSALHRTTIEHNEVKDGIARYDPKGRDGIVLDHRQWRDVKDKLEQLGIVFPSR